MLLTTCRCRVYGGKCTSRHTPFFFAKLARSFRSDRNTQQAALSLFCDATPLVCHTRLNSQADQYGMVKGHPEFRIESNSLITNTKTCITSAIRVPCGEDVVASSRTGATPPTPTRAPEVDSNFDPCSCPPFLPSKMGSYRPWPKVKTETHAGVDPPRTPADGSLATVTLPAASPCSDRETKRSADRPANCKNVSESGAVVSSGRIKSNSWAARTS